jgi:biopolymer transport protein ExbD
MAMSAGPEVDYVTTINVVPLVDIMLVLLIIFIITLPVMTHAVKIDLPRASPDNPPPPTEPPITIEVQYDGQVLWNSNPVNAADMRSYIADAARKDPQPEVHIQVDKGAQYQYASFVLFEVQRGGLNKIGFVADAHGGM